VRDKSRTEVLEIMQVGSVTGDCAMITLLNAFSLNMLAEFPAQPLFEEISIDEAQKVLGEGFASAVGHADTAAVISNLVGLEVSAPRQTVSLRKGDTALIAQYRGSRLPEGATTLPSHRLSGGAGEKTVLFTSKG
jgi:hypothetical protein